MATVRTAGVYMLAEEHAGAIQRFASDPALGRMLGLSDPHSPTAGSDAVARLAAQRLAGEGYWTVIVDEGEVRGVSALIGPYTARPTLQVWIHPASRRRGYGELAVRLALEFAFRNLRLAHVLATVDPTDAGQTSLLTKFGFAPDEPDSVPDPATAPVDYSLTRGEWIAHRDRPALASLHPALRAILDAELAAGNEVVETGGGWPDADSVFVRLRDPFRTKPSPPPGGVVYTEPNDPHWWKADYSTTSPRHILAC
jgi:RimJ/RimL family protein N-acetyltransferase